MADDSSKQSRARDFQAVDSSGDSNSVDEQGPPKRLQGESHGPQAPLQDPESQSPAAAASNINEGLWNNLQMQALQAMSQNDARQSRHQDQSHSGGMSSASALPLAQELTEVVQNSTLEHQPALLSALQLLARPIASAPPPTANIDPTNSPWQVQFAQILASTLGDQDRNALYAALQVPAQQGSFAPRDNSFQGSELHLGRTQSLPTSSAEQDQAQSLLQNLLGGREPASGHGQQFRNLLPSAATAAPPSALDEGNQFGAGSGNVGHDQSQNTLLALLQQLSSPVQGQQLGSQRMNLDTRVSAAINQIGSQSLQSEPLQTSLALHQLISMLSANQMNTISQPLSLPAASHQFASPQESNISDPMSALMAQMVSSQSIAGGNSAGTTAAGDHGASNVATLPGQIYPHGQIGLHTERQDAALLPANNSNPPVAAASTLPEAPDAPTGRPPIQLAMSCDRDMLSPYQCLVRQQIEMFEADQEDVTTNAQGRNHPISLGQVGIRCVHCRFLPPSLRPRGATYYPRTASGLYQAAQNMATGHLCKHCTNLPASLLSELLRLRERKSSAGGGKKYWAEGVRALGVFEAESGLRFESNYSRPAETV